MPYLHPIISPCHTCLHPDFAVHGFGPRTGTRRFTRQSERPGLQQEVCSPFCDAGHEMCTCTRLFLYSLHGCCVNYLELPRAACCDRPGKGGGGGAIGFFFPSRPFMFGSCSMTFQSYITFLYRYYDAC